MFQIFQDALIDSAKMIPLLLIIYIGIELIEYYYGNKIRETVQKAGKTGPLIGALAGSFPQCGFSVIATALYTQRLVTIGTLLAVYLATSDEAIPVILSQPDKANIIFPLIITKIIIAIIGGYLIDFLFRKKNKEILEHIDAYAKGHDIKSHHHEKMLEETACCGHSTSTLSKSFDYHEIIFHPIIHTLKIFGFIFVASFLINFAFFQLGEVRLAKLLLNHSIFQPFIVAVFGLIPNCAASVAITQLYIKGVITYGSVIAGLSSSGGLGLLVLFREEKDRVDVMKIIFLLLGISILAGLIIQNFI